MSVLVLGSTTSFIQHWAIMGFYNETIICCTTLDGINLLLLVQLDAARSP